MSVSLESIKSLSFILDVVEDVWRMFRGIYRPDLKYLIFTKQFRILHMICAFINESFEKISILTNLKFETSAHAEDFFFMAPNTIYKPSVSFLCFHFFT